MTTAKKPAKKAAKKAAKKPAKKPAKRPPSTPPKVQSITTPATSTAEAPREPPLPFTPDPFNGGPVEASTSQATEQPRATQLEAAKHDEEEEQRRFSVLLPASMVQRLERRARRGMMCTIAPMIRLYIEQGLRRDEERGV